VFPIIDVRGDAWQRGLTHGQLLRARIHETFEFYQSHVFTLSSLDDGDIRSRAEGYRDIIAGFHEEHVVEIEGIARGAGIEPWKIFALNARTEILNTQIAECTSLYFPESGMQGQTWDWIRELEDLAVLLRCEYPDGRKCLTLTEPGMLAKVGLNNSGIGVCLNFLSSPQPLEGVPVHALLRRILEATTISEVKELVSQAGRGKTSHILVGDAQGNGLSVEFCGEDWHVVEHQSEYMVHTNHYLVEQAEGVVLPTSMERLERTRQILDASGSLDRDAMQCVLLDEKGGDNAIQCRYHPEASLGDLEIGSCATILMDLPARQMLIKKGPTGQFTFSTVSL